MSFTPTESKAVQHFLAGGEYRLMLNTIPGQVNFQHKVTGELLTRNLVGMVSEYKEHLKEVTRQRHAAEKAEENEKRNFGRSPGR